MEFPNQVWHISRVDKLAVGNGHPFISTETNKWLDIGGQFSALGDFHHRTGLEKALLYIHNHKGSFL